MNIDMNNIYLTYRGQIISLAHHKKDDVTYLREVAVIERSRPSSTEIVARFDDSVESLEKALEMAKAIIKENI